jgi:hypothetical protein
MTNREPAANLNTNSISWPAMEGLFALDKTFLGTENYMGITYFWAYGYRHTMRDTSYANRRLVHKKLLEAGFKHNDENAEVAVIIERWARPEDK